MDSSWVWVSTRVLLIQTYVITSVGDESLILMKLFRNPCCWKQVRLDFWFQDEGSNYDGILPGSCWQPTHFFLLISKSCLHPLWYYDKSLSHSASRHSSHVCDNYNSISIQVSQLQVWKHLLHCLGCHRFFFGWFVERHLTTGLSHDC